MAKGVSPGRGGAWVARLLAFVNTGGVMSEASENLEFWRQNRTAIATGRFHPRCYDCGTHHAPEFKCKGAQRKTYREVKAARPWGYQGNFTISTEKAGQSDRTQTNPPQTQISPLQGAVQTNESYTNRSVNQVRQIGDASRIPFRRSQKAKRGNEREAVDNQQGHLQL